MPTRSSYRWIAIGDIHEASMDALAAIPELAEANGLIITGDITNTGGEAETARVLQAIRAHIPVALAQIGNMDTASVDALLVREGINMHAQARDIAPGLTVIGVGGSTPTPFGTPSEFSEASYTAWLESSYRESNPASQLLLVSHTPPKNTSCDLIGAPDAGMHVGSSAVRAFIERCQPALCLCGHIHEARSEDVIGVTQVINPGNFSAGGYVALSYAHGELSARLRMI